MKHRISPRRLLIILFWIVIWQLAGMIIENDIIFAGPADVVRSFLRLIPDPDFFRSIAHSFGKISIGFLAAFSAGILAGSLAFHFPLLDEFLNPLIQLVKSIPVASFVILALIWIGSGNLSVFISFLVVFPILYVNTITGLQNTDRKLLEMADVFSVRLGGRIRMIYLPALTPYLTSSCKVALGMSWKSGIAAEVIGVPTHTVGENLYMSKIYLATPDLFAWTVVIILVSAGFEKLFLWLMDVCIRWAERSQKVTGRPASPDSGSDMPAADSTDPPAADSPVCLTIRDLGKSYGELPVWDHLNISFQSGSAYCIMGASGSGKTTLFRILLGLEPADQGSFSLESAGHRRLTAVFQGNRLCESFSPLENLMLTAGRYYSRNQLFLELCRLLPEESITRPVSTLSGGMKRRVSIARALLTPSDGILMDEPFTGLDETTKQTVISYIKEKTAGRLLIVATHQEEDVFLLNGKLLQLF